MIFYSACRSWHRKHARQYFLQALRGKLVNLLSTCGFASIDKQRMIAPAAGKFAHLKGKIYKWSSEETRKAGKTGGLTRKKNRSLLNILVILIIVDSLKTYIPLHKLLQWKYCQQ
jgi:hypothetical protein